MSPEDAWVSQVLGYRFSADRAAGLRAAAATPITIPAAGQPAPIRFVSVEGRAVWQRAREEVQTQFGALQAKLASEDDQRLRDVATQGYPALSARIGTGMLAAMTELDAAAPERAGPAQEAALKAIAEQRSLLASDPLVQLLEDNPFGVNVPIRSILGRALDQIEAAVRH